MRNGQVHGENTLIPEVGLTRSLSLLAEFTMAKDGMRNNVRLQPHNQVHRWIRPQVGFLKVNCEASLKNKGYVGIGFAVRTH